MRTILTVALLVAASASAIADDSCFTSSGGDTVRFVDDGENTVSIAWSGEGTTQCSWAQSFEVGPNIQCTDGTGSPYWFASAERDSTSRDLMIFNDDIWYHSECDDDGIILQEGFQLDTGDIPSIPPFRTKGYLSE